MPTFRVLELQDKKTTGRYEVLFSFTLVQRRTSGCDRSFTVINLGQLVDIFDLVPLNYPQEFSFIVQLD